MSAIGQEPQASIVEQARHLLEPVLARDGFELVDVEWLRLAGRWTLRVYIDRPGGVGIEDCQAVSRTVEPMLDVEDFIEPAYDLEVSSPGLDRPLRKPQDFERYAGQRVHVKAFAPVPETAPGQPARKHWTGTLRGFEAGAVALDVDGVTHRIPLDRIAKAHLEYDAEADLRRKD
jgi:ribosome maturation factor RimP